MSHGQFGVRQRGEAVVDMGELREQHVEGGGQRRDHHERPRPARGRRRSSGGGSSPVISAICVRRSRQQRLRRPLAGRGRERERLEVRRGAARGRRGSRLRAADATTGSAPTILASDTSSSARSIACSRGVADSSPKPRSITIGPPVGDEDVRGAEGAVREAGAVHHDHFVPRPRRGARRRSRRAPARRAGARRRSRARAPSNRRATSVSASTVGTVTPASRASSSRNA